MDPFKVLGVTREAPPEVIRAAYGAWVKRYHPDHPDHPEDALSTMQNVNEAYDILRDPEKRAAYERAAKDASADTEATTPRAPGQGQPTVNFCPDPIRRTVRDIGYEILFLGGSVSSVREWIDCETRVVTEHRPFSRNGHAVKICPTPRQQVWVRTDSREVLLEQAGTVLPIACGHAVTLVCVRQQRSSRHDPLPVVLVNLHTGRWFGLGTLGRAVGQVMPVTAVAKDAAKIGAVMLAGISIIFAALMLTHRVIPWLLGAFFVVPLLWNIAPLIARTTHDALEFDVRQAIATVGLSGNH